jgi:AcrR family transcriptional regulator
MKRHTPRSRIEMRTALVAAAQRMLARGTGLFGSAEVERAAGVVPGSLARCFASRAAFAAAVAASVKRSLEARWSEPEAAAPAMSPAAASPRRPSRAALIEAGKRLLSDDRLDGMSIDGIVEEAGVGKGSFFNHFGSRGELVRAVLNEVQGELAGIVERSVAHLDDPVERIAHGFIAGLRYGLANQLGGRAMTRVTPDVTRSSIPVNSALRQLLRAGMVQGGLAPSDVDAAVLMVIGLAEAGLMQLLLVRDDAEHVESLLRALCSTALQMLGVPAKRQAVLVTAALRGVD